MIQTRKHRLSSDNYIGEKFYFITIDLYANYFVDEHLIYVVKDILDATLKKYNIINILSTFMYDHVHLILQGMSENSNLKKCLKSFKSLISIDADIKSAITNQCNRKFQFAGFWH